MNSLVSNAEGPTSIALVDPSKSDVDAWRRNIRRANPTTKPRHFKRQASLSGVAESSLPDVRCVDKHGGWVVAENRERSGVSEDRCHKQVTGRQCRLRTVKLLPQVTRCIG